MRVYLFELEAVYTRIRLKMNILSLSHICVSYMEIFAVEAFSEAYADQQSKVLKTEVKMTYDSSGKSEMVFLSLVCFNFQFSIFFFFKYDALELIF